MAPLPLPTPKLEAVINRFNQGCENYDEALLAYTSGQNPSAYEQKLRDAAIALVGALEWGARVYLNHTCAARLSTGHKNLLYSGKLTFPELLTLVSTYTNPPLDPTHIARFLELRSIRNPVEHRASVPSAYELRDAVPYIADFLTTYLSVDAGKLRSIKARELQLGDLRTTYYEALRKEYQYIDFGGFSPRINNEVVKISMTEVFVPLQAVEVDTLVESFTDGDITLRAPTTAAASRKSSDIVTLLNRQGVVILGDPGSGKSTLCKYLVLSIISGNSRVEVLRDYVPILIRAADYARALKLQPTLSFYHYLTAMHYTKFGPLFEQALNAGRAFVIVDGLDEVPDPESRRGTAKQVERFVSEWGDNNHFLITSRIVGYRHNMLSVDFAHYKLMELTDEQILKFLEGWHQAVSPGADGESSRQQASHFYNEIEANAGVRKLAGNPLLLTIIALIRKRGAKLPNRRVDLYQIATETLVDHWPLNHRGRRLPSEDIVRILEPIAFRIFDSGKDNVIREYDLRPLFEELVCEIRGVTATEARTLGRDLLQQIEGDTGFFVARGLDENNQNIYGFFHSTFAEYLAARYLANKWAGDELELADYVHEPRWHEVILLMAGVVGTWNIAPATKLVSHLYQLQSPYEDVLHRDLFLVSEILADKVAVKRELLDEVASQLISLALSTHDRQVWEDAVEHLAEMAKVLELGNVLDSVRPCSTDSPDRKGRTAAIRVRLPISTDEDIKELLRYTEESSVYGESIYFAMGFDWRLIEEHAVLLAFTQGMREASSRPSSAQALRFLKLRPYVRDLDDLITTIRTGVDTPGLSAWVLDPRELAKVSEADLFHLLTRGGSRSQHLLLQTVLLHRDLKATLALMFRFDMTETDANTRVHALDIIGGLCSQHLGFPISAAQLNRLQVLAADDPDTHVRVSAIRVFSRLPEKHQPRWLSLLQDPDEEVCLAAVLGVRRPEGSVLDTIVQHLSHSSAKIRIAAAMSLLRIQGYGSQSVENLLSAPDEEWPSIVGHHQFEDLIRTAIALERPDILHKLGHKIRDAVLKGHRVFPIRFVVPAKPVPEIVSLIEPLLDHPDDTIRDSAVVTSIVMGDRLGLLNRIRSLVDEGTAAESLNCRDLWLRDLRRKGSIATQAITFVLADEADKTIRAGVSNVLYEIIRHSDDNDLALRLLKKLQGGPNETLF